MAMASANGPTVMFTKASGLMGSAMAMECILGKTLKIKYEGLMGELVKDSGISMNLWEKRRMHR